MQQDESFVRSVNQVAQTGKLKKPLMSDLNAQLIRTIIKGDVAGVEIFGHRIAGVPPP
jgi:hypothetical protein